MIALDLLTLPEEFFRAVMHSRIRQCVECPKCRTRYLIGCSPYSNGSYLVSNITGDADLLRLYCSCSNSPSFHAFKWSELKTYAVSDGAHERGYGSPDEVVLRRDEKEKEAS